MQHVRVCQASVYISHNLEEVIMPLYKITFDKFPAGAVYVTRHALVQVTEDNRTRTRHLTTPKRVRLLEKASFIGTIDKVTEPERKMFWLVFGPTLRAMGVIK